MFYYIEGRLVSKSESYAVIDCGGVGYKIFSSRVSLDSLGDAGSRVRLYTYLYIKSASDLFDLYGFSSVEERDLFEMILGVSGVGAKTAVNLLSNISPSKFALCVITDDSKYLSQNTPGLGPKGAKKLILELKDKFKDADISEITGEDLVIPTAVEDDEAASALVALGYSKDEAQRALIGAEGSTEDKIKYALKSLF